MRKGPLIFYFKIWQLMRFEDGSKFVKAIGEAMNNTLIAMSLYMETQHLEGGIWTWIVPIKYQNINQELHKNASWHTDRELKETQNVTQYVKSTYWPSIGNCIPIPPKTFVGSKDKHHAIEDPPTDGFRMKFVKKATRYPTQMIMISIGGSSCHIHISNYKAPLTASTWYCRQKFCYFGCKTPPTYNNEDVLV